MKKKLTRLEVAWRRWKRTSDYGHTRWWWGKGNPHEGTIWGAFSAGVLAVDPRADEETSPLPPKRRRNAYRPS